MEHIWFLYLLDKCIFTFTVGFEIFQTKNQKIATLRLEIISIDMYSTAGLNAYGLSSPFPHNWVNCQTFPISHSKPNLERPLRFLSITSLLYTFVGRASASILCRCPSHLDLFFLITIPMLGSWKASSLVFLFHSPYFLMPQTFSGWLFSHFYFFR